MYYRNWKNKAILNRVLSEFTCNNIQKISLIINQIICYFSNPNKDILRIIIVPFGFLELLNNIFFVLYQYPQLLDLFFSFSYLLQEIIRTLLSDLFLQQCLEKEKKIKSISKFCI